MLEAAKEKKITDRIIAHQLIILENTGSDSYIEKINIREFGNVPEGEPSIKIIKGNGQQPSTIVRPSSLNYKISLREAVQEFIKKDMPCNDDQYVHVETEENKQQANQQGKQS